MIISITICVSAPEVQGSWKAGRTDSGPSSQGPTTTRPETLRMPGRGFWSMLRGIVKKSQQDPHLRAFFNRILMQALPRG